MLIEKGRVILEGNPADVVALHEEHSERTRAEKAAEAARMMGAATT
jgi:hypothetical protein